MRNGTKFKVMRIVRGMTQTQLARLVGVRQEEISFLERDRPIPPATAAQVKAKLDWPPEEAFALLES